MPACVRRMKGYSIFSIARHAIRGHRSWSPVWSDREPKRSYDVVIVGGGGHGLATAYYLARKHGIRNVAVLEKGSIGGGNTGRNTQVVRSNYYWKESAAFYDRSLMLYERLGGELNFNVMLSQRGVLSLAHSHHELEILRRWANAIRINGVDSELLARDDIRRLEPLLDLDCCVPVVGGFIQRRGGIARHDAVAWGFARAANAQGADIIQGCEVTGFTIHAGRVRGVETTRGEIATDCVVLAAAGDSTPLAAKAGIRVPITNMTLQAMVSEPVKPVLNTVTVSSAIHMYVSQSDRGEIVLGGGTDTGNSYARRGGLPLLERNVSALVELFPAFKSIRLMRQWAGTVDITPDASPIMGYTPIEGLFINAGWGTGGFKAIPAGGETMAWTIANGCPHPLISPFGLDRFARGELIDEAAAAGVAH